MNSTYSYEIKELYFEQIGQIDHLHKILLSWKSGGEFPTIHAPSVRAKASYEKILFVCRQDIADCYQHVWIDTCCINKSSSAELSEAINSMVKAKTPSSGFKKRY
jgi:hypothetical protein